jgi:hypothetical protein
MILADTTVQPMVISYVVFIFDYGMKILVRFPGFLQ